VERPVLSYFLIVTAIVIFAALRSLLDKKPRWRQFFEFLGRIEIITIAVLLASLIFFGCLQIVLRNFFQRGIVWADPFMRHVVLWLGCLGGAVATTRIRHITIDVLTRYLSGPLEVLRDKVVYLATAVASSILGLAALGLVIQEQEYGAKAFLFVDTWVAQAILPIAFFLITYRSLLNMFLGRKAKPLEWEDIRGEKGGDE
jgi:TRAP-type C4-dicarboxylate transport system permease small subunit